MNTKQPEAIRIAEWLEGIRGNTWPSYIPQEAAAELRRQHDLLGKANALCRIRAARIAELQAGYDAAHPQNAEKLPRVPLHETVRRMADRIEELQDQLAAVSADGMRTLMLAPAQDDSLTAAYMAGAHDAEKAARKRLDGTV